MYLRWAAVAITLSTTGALAQAAPGGFGQGISSCASWLSDPVFERDGHQWILGFWMGLNVSNASNKDVGSHSDAQAIWGEVKRICTEEPSTQLAEAAQRVYRRFQQDGK
jgi:hypothetical protein